MKFKPIIIFILLIMPSMLVFSACSVEPSPDSHRSQDNNQTGSKILLLSVQGVHCASCANTIKANLSHEPGVQSLSVNYQKSSDNIEISYDEKLISPEQIKEKIRQLNFKVL